MRFSLAEQLHLPCRFERIIPGQLHRDGRRYLPLLIFALELPPQPAPTAIRHVGVVDRHHLVDPQLIGAQGSAQLLFLLSRISLSSEHPIGLFDTLDLASRASTAPHAVGHVRAIGAWETEREHLPYESLYAELTLDIGIGTIGVRTSTTASNLTEQLGKARFDPGDTLLVERSRIDILGFRADSA
ncbi:MAG: hypothetical protein Fur005_22440 [Roseiflexaceae bacterium]